MKHQNTSYRELISNHLLWFYIAVAVSAALILWLCSGASAETSQARAGAVAAWDLAEPNDLVATSQGDDTTAFREQDAGISAHHRVPDHFQEDGQNDLRPRLNVMAITDALLEDPDESNDNRQVAGHHVDSGSNFGIVELPMVAAQGFGSEALLRKITVYYDDRGWVVAYLPADAPAAGIWRYSASNQQADDLKQNLLLLAVNEVLSVARQDVPEIVEANHDTVGYYHWQHPDHNAFVLFSHASNGGTSDPIRFVVPPTIGGIRASAAVLITDSRRPDQSTTSAELMVDEQAVVTVEEPSRLAVAGFDLQRSSDVTRLYEVTVVVDDDETAEGVVMLLYTKPSS